MILFISETMYNKTSTKLSLLLVLEFSSFLHGTILYLALNMCLAIREYDWLFLTRWLLLSAPLFRGALYSDVADS